MSDSAYDEFGNYIGDQQGDTYGFDIDIGQGEEEADPFANGEEAMDVAKVEEDENNKTAIVLAEDKKYYPEADEVYPGVATATMNEDAQDIEEPLVDPMLNKNIYAAETSTLDELKYNTNFIAGLMSNPALVRHVAFMGHIHHGKTSLVHHLFQGARAEHEARGTQCLKGVNKEIRLHGVRPDEIERAVSLKTTLTSLPLEDFNGKHLMVNMIDCPGHVDFFEDILCISRSVDGVVLVVDALEGVMGVTKKAIKAGLEAGCKLTLVINKVDRLILELRIPPEDAYLKLAHTILEVNSTIEAYTPTGKAVQVLSPERGNVCFSSSLHGWTFSLESFALVYCQKHNNKGRGMDPHAFSRRLWGNWFYREDSRLLTRERRPGGASPRSFVHYVLKPLYKIYSYVMGDEVERLQGMLQGIGHKYSKTVLKGNANDVLTTVLSGMFGFSGSIVRMLGQHVPSPAESNAGKVSSFYTGPVSSVVGGATARCDPHGPLVMHVTKVLFHNEEREFYSLARIYSGKVRSGQSVLVLGNDYSAEDREDAAPATVTRVCLGVGTHVLDLADQDEGACAGNIVLLRGVEATIGKGATIVDTTSEIEDHSIFSNAAVHGRSVMSVAIEPLKPSDLPKMLDGLRSLDKIYPAVKLRVEESGEHVLFGTGELFLDCVTHDLRKVFSDLEIKIADPFTALRETVAEASSLQCFASTANGRNRFTGIAEPLDKGISADLEAGVVSAKQDPSDRAFLKTHLKKSYGWDSLATNSIWAFGPDAGTANVLLDDTLPHEVDKKVLWQAKNSIVQGFQWGTREGPLCDESMRDVKFKILDAALDPAPIHRGGGQVIPASRRLVYSSYLVATPRLMEPVYSIEIQTTTEMAEAAHTVLNRRRGHVVKETAVPGAPFSVLQAYIPVIESFGFQVDLRTYTQGQVFAQLDFDHWAVAPGDPMDSDVILHPLEPSPPAALSRDFMLKTRRRKGLPEDVSFARFFDDAMLLKLNEEADET